MIDKYEHKKRPIPEAFRASLDVSQRKANAILKQADEQQKEWSVGVASPFANDATPNGKQRAKAVIEIESLEKIGTIRELLPVETEILAEKYAIIGRYDVAADLSETNHDLYKQYWDAVWLDDDDWCQHTKHQYIKEYVYSIKENAEMPLLACNVPHCRKWNVLDAPKHLKDASALRAKVRGAVSGRSQDEVKDYLNRNFKTTNP